MYFDPMYLLFLLPAMAIAAGAQWLVKSRYASASKVLSRSGVRGADAAAAILRQSGVSNCRIERGGGFLSDHYNPRKKLLSLSPDVYNGTSLASLGIAAHEAGHALQDGKGYGPLKFRNGIIPLANIGSNASTVLIFLGFVLNIAGLVWIAIALFSATVIFQLINLVVEFDASARAKQVLVGQGLITQQELPVVSKVLSAAALTYVAATLTAIVTLLYFVLRASQMSSRD